MSHVFSSQTIVQVQELRRLYSICEVARRTGLRVRTVKSICSKSSAFQDNQALRGLFRLPKIQDGILLPGAGLPSRADVTGDHEVDTVLWLREVIWTGDEEFIEKALKRACYIKAPVNELENRYRDYLDQQDSARPSETYKALGFADLEELAIRSRERLATLREATARLGNRPFATSPAEQFCIDVLSGLNFVPFCSDDYAAVDQRFQSYPEFLPHTLSDCVYERVYWLQLLKLRHCLGGTLLDSAPVEAHARLEFIVRCMGRIRPMNRKEARMAYRHLEDTDSLDEDETPSEVLLNLEL